MDTYMQAEVYGDRQTVNDIKAEIESLDKKLSSVNPESEIYKLNKSGGLELDGESAELIKRSVELCGFKSGALSTKIIKFRLKASSTACLKMSITKKLP